MISFDRLLPRSLVGRVFALYAVVLLLFVGTGVGLFLHHRFTQELNDVLERSDSLVQVAAPTVADSAVIGDYDTIRRTLERAILHSDHAGAAFIDVQGGKVEVRSPDRPSTAPPAWLQRQIEARMADTNLPINVGGRDYGVLRFTFAHDRVAGDLWQQFLYTVGLAAIGLAGGLVLLRVPLGYWLSDLSRIGNFEAQMSGPRGAGLQELGEHAPIEFKQTFDVLNRAAASIQAQRERAAATLGAIGDGVLTLDPQGRVILCNPAASEMLGRAEQDLIGQLAHELLPGLFLHAPAREPWQARHCEVSARGGELRVFNSNLSSICGPAGEVHGHVLALRDITEQHALDLRLRAELAARERAMTALRGVLEGLLPDEADRAGMPKDDLAAVSALISSLVTRLQERGEQLNAIFALSPDGFVSFDARGRINYVSPGFEPLTGLGEEQVTGLSETQLAALLTLHGSSGQAALADFGLLRGRTDGGHHRRMLIELSRPTKRVLELGLRQSSSQAVSQVLYLRDVTHESEVEQMKSEFLSTAAHELRTPMASIYGFSELMMSGRLSAERQVEVISTIHRQSQLMVSVVNELLDLARIEARRGKDFNLEDVDLRQLVAQVLHDFKPPHERASPLTRMPEQAMPVRVDQLKLAQALGNVVSNAYKYSPGGGEVQVRLVQRTASGAEQVGVEVRDHGIGMTAEQLSRVCERFYRADESGAIPGTGLGMSIVKEIVELLGGALDLASEHRLGTTVTLWLPLSRPRVGEARENADPVTTEA